MKKYVTALVLSLSSIHVQAATVRYTYTDLGTLGGSGSEAFGINNAGRIVGWSYDERNTGTRPTLWSNGAVISLGNFGVANAINATGTIAGMSWDDGNTPRPTAWSAAGAATPLQIGTAATGEARSINDSGTIGGYVRAGAAWPYLPLQSAVWDATTGTIGKLPAWVTAVYGINAAGAAVGESSNLSAVSCANGDCTALPTLGGSAGGGRAINDSGIIVGYSYDARNAMRATAWVDGNAIDLGSLAGGHASANAINNDGDVVGYSINSALEYTAVLWRDGAGIIDLNSLLQQSVLDAGWRLTEAADINDLGWIVGTATSTHTGQRHAFLLAPVPEPSAYLMLLAGGAVLGAFGRRRKAG